MNELNTKIWDFVLSNQIIKDKAFFYRLDQSRFKDFIWDNSVLQYMDDSDLELYTNTDWLYHTNCSTSFSVIGVHKSTGLVYAISGQGDIFYLCKYFQLLPYYLIREHTGIDDENDFYDYFKDPRNEGREEALRKYEAWFNAEGIILDKYNFFINEDGSYNPEAFFSDSEGE
jgi:hypothetical protein